MIDLIDIMLRQDGLISLVTFVSERDSNKERIHNLHSLFTSKSSLIFHKCLLQIIYHARVICLNTGPDNTNPTNCTLLLLLYISTYKIINKCTVGLQTMS